MGSTGLAVEKSRKDLPENIRISRARAKLREVMVFEEPGKKIRSAKRRWIAEKDPQDVKRASAKPRECMVFEEPEKKNMEREELVEKALPSCGEGGGWQDRRGVNTHEHTNTHTYIYIYDI